MTSRREFLVLIAAAGAASAVAVPADAGSVSSAKIAADPLRPQYHLLPRANWMNDPNGPVYWNGSYHMFYQYNPHGAYWGDMHWGHAVSADMVHWRQLPVALSPTAGGPDADGCFTGTAVVQDGRVMLMYTGVRAASREMATIKDGNPPLLETQCLAIADDAELKSWTKMPAPVIAAPPSGMQVNGFRDPSPWRQGEWWYTVLGSGVANEGGAVLLYRSRDLRAWEYVHVLASHDRSGLAQFGPFDPWDVWECPEFFPLGGRHVLMFSTGGKSYWQSGRLDVETMTFAPEQSGILDYGSYYAPKTQLDKAGNRILWGWIQEARPVAEYKGAGWAGMMSLPRVLSLGEDGRLRFGVAGEVKSLRGRERSLKDAREVEAVRIAGCCGEIVCMAKRDARFEWALMGDGSPWLVLGFDPGHRDQVLIDGRPVRLHPGVEENLEFHLFVDGSVIEVMVNQRVAWTKRFYYAGNGQDLRMRWKGAGLVGMSVWEVRAISGDRLTS